MEDRCYYCKKEGVVKDFLNPYTEEYHPTCSHCIAEFTTFLKERKAFANIGCFVVPLLILCSIASFIFIGWEVGLGFVAIDILALIISSYGVEYYIKQRDKKLGKYVDTSKIRWCKTCKHYKKIRKYEKTIDGLWASEEMISDSDIPCRILDEVREVWESYYALPREERSLFPKDCDKWTN